MLKLKQMQYEAKAKKDNTLLYHELKMKKKMPDDLILKAYPELADIAKIFADYYKNNAGNN